MSEFDGFLSSFFSFLLGIGSNAPQDPDLPMNDLPFTSVYFFHHAKLKKQCNNLETPTIFSCHMFLSNIGSGCSRCPYLFLLNRFRKWCNAQRSLINLSLSRKTNVHPGPQLPQLLAVPIAPVSMRGMSEPFGAADETPTVTHDTKKTQLYFLWPKNMLDFVT